MRQSLNSSSALIVILAGCALPSPVTAPEPLSPPPSYEEAVAMIAQRQAADDSVVVSGGRSILLTHGTRTARVFVLLHGFTDLPEQFAAVGQHLYAGGDNVYIPRLPRHGERRSPMRSLGRISASELARFGDSSVAIARGLGDSIVVMGLSAGGVIAASVAQVRGEVKRAVLLAPAIAAASLSDGQEQGLVILASKLPEITRTNAPLDSTRPEYLQGITTRGLAQLLLLGQQVREASGNRAPGARQLFFLLNEADHTVSEEAAIEVAQHWYDHGAQVEVYRFPASLKLQHNLMEIDARGGNVSLVFPVVEALALGATPPRVAELQNEPCRGLRCALRRSLRP